MNSRYAIAAALLSLTLFSACNPDRKDPLTGSWKLVSITATPPAAVDTQGPPVGAVFSFRPDSTLVIPPGSMPLRYVLERRPEGMFIAVGDSPARQYRVVAMTPAALSLQENRGDAQINLQLELQKQ